MRNEPCPERKVLDKGYVQLVDYMGNNNTVVDAARVSFDKTSDEYTEEQNDRLLLYLINHGHESPFEHLVYQFRVSAPVVVWWHWVRHRLFSFNFVSGRYIPFEETAVYRVDDDMWRLQSESNKQGSKEGEYLPDLLGAIFNERIDRLYATAYGIYDDMLKAGVAKEQARLALPDVRKSEACSGRATARSAASATCSAGTGSA